MLLVDFQQDTYILHPNPPPFNNRCVHRLCIIHGSASVMEQSSWRQEAAALLTDTFFSDPVTPLRSIHWLIQGRETSVSLSPPTAPPLSNQNDFNDDVSNQLRGLHFSWAALFEVTSVAATHKPMGWYNKNKFPYFSKCSTKNMDGTMTWHVNRFW